MSTPLQRKRLSNLLVAVISLAVILTTLEIVLRYDDHRPKATYAEVTLGATPYSLFDDPTKLERLEDAIVFIGDSFTEGSACGRDRNYPVRFETQARGEGLDIKAVNFGKIDTNTFAHLTLARDLVGASGPAYGAVITLFVNDIELNCALCPHIPEIAASGRFDQAELDRLSAFCAECGGAADARTHYGLARSTHRWLYEQSYSYRLLREAVYAATGLLGLDLGWGAAYPEQWRDQDGLSFKLLQLSTELLVDTFDAAGVPVLIVLYPPTQAIGPENPYATIYRDVAQRLADATGAPVHSGYAAFLESPEARSNMRFSITDGHPSCLAHQLFAAWTLHTYKTAYPAGTPGPTTPAPAELVGQSAPSQ